MTGEAQNAEVAEDSSVGLEYTYGAVSQHELDAQSRRKNWPSYSGHSKSKDPECSSLEGKGCFCARAPRGACRSTFRRPSASRRSAAAADNTRRCG
eukprot:6211801-Pleurochrysis_carterae.AAC.2